MDRITEVTRDCFDAVIQLRRLDESAFPSPAALRERLRRFVDALFQRAAQAGFSREDTNDIAYAVVALADEVIIQRSDALRDAWAGQSLQLHYFHENVAGEGFFTRLQNVRRDPRRREILQAYYLALLLGFQGRYRVRGGEAEILALLDDVSAELARDRRFDAEVLSPHGDRPEEGRHRARTGGVELWVALAAILVAVLAYAGFRVSLGISSDHVVQRIESLDVR